MATVTAKLTGGNKAANVLAQYGNAASARVKVGYLHGATYPDGTPVAQVAFWQEFGTPGATFPIPPRPTFRAMIAKHSKEWGGQLAKLLKASGYDSHVALGQIGELMSDELIDSILHADVAQLSAVTLMLRQMRADQPGLKVALTTVFEAIRRVKAGETGATGTGAKRLVDSGVMAHTPSYEVLDGAQST